MVNGFDMASCTSAGVPSHRIHCSKTIVNWTRAVVFAAARPAVGAASVGVLIARVIVVYGFGWLTNRFAEPIPLSWQHILTWGGLRGALSLALALSLPLAFGPERDLLWVMAFGVVLFTLLAQGLTMGPLLRRLRITVREPKQIACEIQHGRLASLRVAEQHLERQYREGLFSTHTWEDLKAEVEAQAAALSAEVHEMVHAEPVLGVAEMRAARGELLRAQRSALMDLQHSGVISDEALDILSAEVNAQLAGDRGSAAG